jgi:hypothetical protein
MQALKEAPKTSAPAVLAPSRGGEKVSPQVRRGQEVTAWIMIAAIWGTFAFCIYLIWVKANAGV